jgi:hypothetical protein
MLTVKKGKLENFLSKPKRVSLLGRGDASLKVPTKARSR